MSAQNRLKPSTLRRSVHEPLSRSDVDSGRPVCSRPFSHWAQTWRLSMAGREPHSSPVALTAPEVLLGRGAGPGAGAQHRVDAQRLAAVHRHQVAVAVPDQRPPRQFLGPLEIAVR